MKVEGEVEVDQKLLKCSSLAWPCSAAFVFFFQEGKRTLGGGEACGNAVLAWRWRVRR